MPIIEDNDLPASIAQKVLPVNFLTLVDRIDVSNTEQLAALCHGLEISREALQAIVEALQPAIPHVRFYAMR